MYPVYFSVVGIFSVYIETVKNKKIIAFHRHNKSLLIHLFGIDCIVNLK